MPYSYDGGCGDLNCDLCKADAEAQRMKMNNDPEWLRKMAELEDGCDVSVGGMEHAELLARLCKPGASPPEHDAPLCSDCPPVGYPTDKTRCDECPRRAQKEDDRG